VSERLYALYLLAYREFDTFLLVDANKIKISIKTVQNPDVSLNIDKKWVPPADFGRPV